MRKSESSGMICSRSEVPAQRARGCLMAALLLASIGWISSSAAQAGCSHSVMTKADAARLRIAHLDPMLLAGASSAEPMRNIPLKLPSTPPCSGFRCSGNSIPWSPVSIPQGTPRIDAWNRSDLRAPRFARQFLTLALLRRTLQSAGPSRKAHPPPTLTIRRPLRLDALRPSGIPRFSETLQSRRAAVGLLARPRSGWPEIRRPSRAAHASSHGGAPPPFHFLRLSIRCSLRKDCSCGFDETVSH